MATEFKLPELGENIESGDVTKILVREGDQIEANQGVIELETEKAVVEIPCSLAGRVTRIHVKSGDTVKVGQTILTIEPEEEAAAEPSAPIVEKPKPEQKPATSPAAEEDLRTAQPGEEAKLQAAEGKAKPQAAGKEAGPQAAEREAAGETELLPAGPAARRLARELGVDLRAVEGTGLRGRITPEDVQQASAPAAAEAAPPGEAGRDAWGPVRRERMSRIRRTIAQQMVRSAETIPHVTNFDDADVTDLEYLRKSIPADYLGGDVKLTMMPFLLKAAARALVDHPILNARLDEENDEIVYKQYVNLGVAVDTPRGLVVPVVRNAERLSIPEIARALAAIAERARAARFTPEETRGGTFTVSNMGAVGGAYATPIINHPEVAILLVGRTRWRPAVREDRVEPRYLMPLSLSYDHRVVDGAAAARFFNDVIGYLQTPAKLLIAP